MIDSVGFYNAAFHSPHKKFNYLQIVSTVFYELLTQKNSPLLSEMCSMNGITFAAQNFQLEKLSVSRLSYANNSFDMYCIVSGLNEAFSKNLDACAKVYESMQNYMFVGASLPVESFQHFMTLLQNLDKHLEKFSAQEKKFLSQAVNEEKILLQKLDFIARTRKGDDEKIIAEIIDLQATLQNSLQQILEIRDDIDFRTLKEPVNQLIFLYNKIDDNLKRHPQEDAAKGYAALIKRCQSFLKYIIQSLEMLGVEIIDETGKTFDPDLNKVIDNENISLDSVVTKVHKIGFIYKGKVLEKSLVEVAGGN